MATLCSAESSLEPDSLLSLRSLPALGAKGLEGFLRAYSLGWNFLVLVGCLLFLVGFKTMFFWYCLPKPVGLGGLPTLLRRASRTCWKQSSTRRARLCQ